MATINCIWNGEDDYTSESATAYCCGIGQGYYVPPSYRESWTGSNFTYTSNGGHPTGGALKSWTFQQTGRTFAYAVTDLNYTVPAGSMYPDLIEAHFAGRDDWHGNGGDNFFYWSIGGDTRHGDAAISTLDSLDHSKAVLIGNRPSIMRNGDLTVVAAISDLDVTLDSVERLRFSDCNVALDMDSRAGTAARIADAVFGREMLKSKELMGLAMDLLDSGMTPQSLTEPVLQAKLGVGYTNTQLVNLLHKNLTNAAPTALDAQLYGSMLDDGLFTGAELAQSGAESALNAANIDLAGLAKTGLDYSPWQG
jgi:hypothetical protein